MNNRLHIGHTLLPVLMLHHAALYILYPKPNTQVDEYFCQVQTLCTKQCLTRVPPGLNSFQPISQPCRSRHTGGSVSGRYCVGICRAELSCRGVLSEQSLRTPVLLPVGLQQTPMSVFPRCRSNCVCVSPSLSLFRCFLCQSH